MVPAWTLSVGGGSAPEPISDRAAKHEPSPAADVQEAPPVRETPAEVQGIDRRYLAAGAVAFVLLAGGWALVRNRRRRTVVASPRKASHEDPSCSRKNGTEAKNALRNACHANDARAAAQALLDWAAATWSGEVPRNLGTLATRLDRGAEPVRELERRLYAPELGPWDGVSLWRAMQEGLLDARATSQRESEALEPLYPQRT
jgi:hypothetical protein